MNLFDALEAVSIAGNFGLRTEVSDQGLLLAAINGLKATKKQGWTCYLNGRKVRIPLDEQVVNPDDVIMCKYEQL